MNKNIFFSCDNLQRIINNALKISEEKNIDYLKDLHELIKVNVQLEDISLITDSCVSLLFKGCYDVLKLIIVKYA
jgi:hypothetical protein